MFRRFRCDIFGCLVTSIGILCSTSPNRQRLPPIPNRTISTTLSISIPFQPSDNVSTGSKLADAGDSIPLNEPGNPGARLPLRCLMDKPILKLIWQLQHQSFLPMFVSEYRRHPSPLIHTFIGLSGPTTTQLAVHPITFHLPPMPIASRLLCDVNTFVTGCLSPFSDQMVSACCASSTIKEPITGRSKEPVNGQQRIVACQSHST